MSTTTLKVTTNNKKKTATTKTALPTPAVNELVPEVIAEVAPKKVVRKTKTATTTTAAVPAPVVEEVIPAAPITLNPVIVEDVKTEIKKRRVATRDSLLNSFDELYESINTEILNNKDDKNVNGKHLKFLRGIGKTMTIMKRDAQKLIRAKKKDVDGTSTAKDTNKVSSGFLKPVPISTAMASFTGWAPTELKSRVDVTKFLCSYIKENNLQNPDDRRQIILDSKLSKLLDYKDGTSLTYFDMQSHLKKHFPKPVVA
jgi:chromatin remodeling complex protein RSC6